MSENHKKISYLCATNMWKVLEGIWAVNNKPMPPSGLAFDIHSELTCVPCENWFDRLLLSESITQGAQMIKILNWLLPHLQ